MEPANTPESLPTGPKVIIFRDECISKRVLMLLPPDITQIEMHNCTSGGWYPSFKLLPKIVTQLQQLTVISCQIQIDSVGQLISLKQLRKLTLGKVLRY